MFLYETKIKRRIEEIKDSVSGNVLKNINRSFSKVSSSKVSIAGSIVVFAGSESTGQSHAYFIIVQSVVYLFLVNDFPHLTRVGPFPKVYEHDHPIDEKDETNTEKHDEVGLDGSPSDECSALNMITQGIVRNPHVYHIKP